MGLVTGIPANALIPKFGIRNSTLLATTLFVVGMFVRTLLGKSFYMVIIGQAIAGLGSPFVGNGIGGFAAHWYSGSTVRPFI
jgi:MFS family permease